MQNVDGIVAKKPSKPAVRRKKEPKIARTARTIGATGFVVKLFEFLAVVRKYFKTIAFSSIITLLLSIATSPSLADKNAQNSAEIKGMRISANLPRENDLSVINKPINQIPIKQVLDKPAEAPASPAEIPPPPDPLQKRKESLKKYLSSKKSILAEHVDTLSQQSNWKLIIAMSRAESLFCKRHAGKNCWGIGGAWNLKTYKNYDEAITDVNRIIDQHYIQQGMDSPKKMMVKWVGHKNEDWQSAVEQELENLNIIE